VGHTGDSSVRAFRPSVFPTFRLFLVFGIAACSPGAATLEVGTVEFSGPPGSAEPNLSATNDGQILFSWHEPTEDGSALRMAVRYNGEWSAPRTIAENRAFFVNWADFPSLIALHDGTLLAHWLEKTAKSTYAYHVMLSRSTDGGATWSDPVRPHRDLSPQEHGFVSMVPGPGGGAALMWLDGRAMAGQVGPDGHPSGAMSVRFTTMGADGALGDELLIDERACDCCQTALALTHDGTWVAAYRDRSAEEIRDIAVSRLVDGAWSDPIHVGNDNWHITGCPVNGPALATNDETVVIAWYSAPDGNGHASVAFSRDDGVTFGGPVRVDDGNPLGRVDVELLQDGSALVVWLEKVGTEAEVRARRVEPSGVTGPSWIVTQTSQARRSGFPHMARSGDDLVFAWTDGEGVRVASGKIQ
ncbi:MAG: sialidase family protein, partial [Gemmatimonadetes bacterium]|nr:sialidase family protein [Gemmatimonadota bacterium]